MKKLIVMLLALGVLVIAGGCMPASQQEVLQLTNMVNQIVPAVRQAVSNSSDETKDKIEIVLGQVEEVNEAVATAETPTEAIKAGWDATKGFNPYYGYGLLAITVLEGLGIMKEKKKTAKLQKGVNRILGEAQPEQSKAMYDKIKTYTG